MNGGFRRRFASLAGMAGALCRLALALALALAPAAQAADIDTLMGLSIEELSSLEVSILAKRPERIMDSAAAVYVLTGDDIRRSGYTSIAEVLRLVPGMDVARVDTAEWAVSARGFGSRFANKLLVLVDGRSVYSALFSGTFWESIDTLLEDVERIEVIRGPGASTWGSNAVNGVVNIITRHAGATQGGLAVGYAGDLQRGAGLRFGGRLGDEAFVRVYGKYNDRDPRRTVRGPRDDDAHGGGRIGFRADWEPAPAQSLTLEGEWFDEDADDPWLRGGHLLMNWERRGADGRVDTMQLYYDRTDLNSGVVDQDAVNERADTLDLELRRRFAPLDRHDLIAGLAYRFMRSEIEPHLYTTAVPPVRRSHRLSAFVQDEITLLADRWYFTLGAKLEHNDFSGFEIQPTLRSRWHPDERSVLWAAVSRAVRVPSRSESDLFAENDLAFDDDSLDGVPLKFRSEPDGRFREESLIAYELGYRWRHGADLLLDLALFYNDYEHLRTLEIGEPYVSADPEIRVVVPGQVLNLMQGQTYGLELAVQWRPHARWRVQGSYGLLRMQLDAAAESTGPDPEAAAGQSPQQQLGLRLSVDLAQDWELDLIGRYVDRRDAFALDAYTELDARLGWHVSRGLSLALVGRNLLHPDHVEYGKELLGRDAHRLEREWLLRAELRF